MLRLIFVTALFGAGTVWSLRSVVGGACFLLWADIFRPTRFARYAAWLDHRGAISPYDYVYLVFLVSLIVTRWRKRWTGTTTVVVAFLAWVWVCTFFARDVPLAMTKAVEATKYTVPLILLSMALRTRRDLQLVLYTLALSVGIWMAHYGFITLTGKGTLIEMSIPSGQMADRNDFLVAGTGCVPLLFYMAWRYEGPFRKWGRRGLLAMALLSLVPFATALSRGAVVGLGGLTLFYTLGMGRTRPKFAAAVVVAAAAFLMFMPDPLEKRMSTFEFSLDPADQSEKSARNRLIHMKTAVLVTLDNPVFGVGPRNFPYVGQQYGDHHIAEPHCIWLKASSEYGVPMLIFFVGLVITLVVRLRRLAIRAHNSGDAETEAMATAIACAIVGFLSTGTFTSQFMSEYLWAILVLAGTFLATESAGPLTPAPGTRANSRAETPVAARA